MSDQQRFRWDSGALARGPIADFWQLSRTEQDPSIPNLPLEDPAAGGGITANLSQTLGTISVTAVATSAISAQWAQSMGAITLASAAANANDADVAQTLGAVTLTAAAGVRITAVASDTLGAVAVTSAAGVAIAAALSQTLGEVTLSAAASSQEERAAELEQTLGQVTLSADATVSQPSAEPEAQPEASRRGVVFKRGRRKPSFIGVPDRPLRVVPPVTLNPITADVNVTLGDVQITATASMGEAPASRRRRLVAAALLLH